MRKFRTESIEIFIFFQGVFRSEASGCRLVLCGYRGGSWLYKALRLKELYTAWGSASVLFVADPLFANDSTSPQLLLRGWSVLAPFANRRGNGGKTEGRRRENGEMASD